MNNICKLSASNRQHKALNESNLQDIHHSPTTSNVPLGAVQIDTTKNKDASELDKKYQLNSWTAHSKQLTQYIRQKAHDKNVHRHVWQAQNTRNTKL